MLAGSFSGGVIVGWVLPGITGAIIPERLSDPVGSDIQVPPIETPSADITDNLFDPFWEAWDIVHDQYVDQPVDDLSLMRGAIQGMLASLDDPYTSYMDPEQYERQKTPLEGRYEGIGAWVDITGEYLMIISPIPDTPAEEKGLKPGDLVIAIDGEDMIGIDGELVLKRILGPAGTEVTLTILRESEPEPFDVTIMRAKITIPSAVGELLDENIAYIQLYNFGQNTQKELRDALKELLVNNPDGLILDLRYNGGGYLNTAVSVVSEFIETDMVVLYEEMGDGSRRTFTTSGNGLATEIPLVVLINEGSASASEIAAGAIQDHERGLLVGTTTFGKGLVQNWVPLTSEDGAIRVTIARWLTPDERQIHKLGLEPDVLVELTDEDIELERDPQLEKAIEILTTGI
jgi:carboxyl-terminal processing protease